MRFVLFLFGSLAVSSCGFEPPPVDPAASRPGGSSGASSSGAPGHGAGAASPGGVFNAGGAAAGSGARPNAPQAGSTGSSAGTSAGGNGGAAGVGGTAPEHFELLWRDDFDSFDTTRWAKATHTFPENLARFSADNARVEGGLLKLRVTNVQNGDKPYSAAEVYTLQDFTFGRFEGRIKFCAGSGLVSSLFTYKQNVEESWQEIDIEHLGNLPKSIQYNLIYGSLNDRKYQPKVVTFQWSPTLEFHDYAIEWKPDGITFYVDGQETHHDVQATLQDAAKLHMNVWPTDNAVTSFAGPLDASAIPCEAQYDWVQAYSYTP
jgi:beta-glucanase (GH16 family)